MMELLLAKIDANLKEVKDEMLAKIDPNQAKMKADREGMTARPEAIHDKTDANKKGMKEDNNEKSDVLQGTLISRMNMHQEKMDALIAGMNGGRKARTA
jgi:hypothetical protein